MTTQHTENEEDFGWCALVVLMLFIVIMACGARLSDAARWAWAKVRAGAALAWCLIESAWWVAIAGQLPPERREKP